MIADEKTKPVPEPGEAFLAEFSHPKANDEFAEALVNMVKIVKARPVLPETLKALLKEDPRLRSSAS